MNIKLVENLPSKKWTFHFYIFETIYVIVRLQGIGMMGEAV